MQNSIWFAAVIFSVFMGVVTPCGAVYTQMPPKKAKFMLSFDDGPLPGATERVLETLASLRANDGKPVKAGFFMLADAPDTFLQGRAYYAPYEIWIDDKGSIAKHPEIAQKIQQAGHIVGNHTTHHSWFRWPWMDTPDAIVNEITGWEMISKPVLGTVHPRLFRPPYLILTDTVRETARRLGYRVVLGETVGDANPGISVEEIEEKSESILKEWDKPYPCVLIFHDTLPATYEHLGQIVGHLQKQGFRLVHFDPHQL